MKDEELKLEEIQVLESSDTVSLGGYRRCNTGVDATLLSDTL
jgi:hypothetical protein